MTVSDSGVLVVVHPLVPTTANNLYDPELTLVSTDMVRPLVAVPFAGGRH